MNRYELRKLTVDDLKLVLNWRNKDKIRLNMINSKKITWKEHCQWFESLQLRKDRETMVFHMDNKPMGLVYFNDITEESCNWGFYIGEDKSPKGVGLMLGYHGIEYIFNEYSINKIESQVINFNKISVAFHEKLFFKQVGIQLKAIYRDDIYYDLFSFELLKTTWFVKKNEVFLKALAKIN